VLSVGRFALGLAATAGVVAAMVIAARAVRVKVLPGWRGPPAWLADVTVSMAVLVGVAQLLGAVHRFRSVPVLAAELAAATAVLLIARRLHAAPDEAPAPSPAPMPRRELVVALVGVALIAFQWATHVGYAVSRGMTYSDTLWYHQPFAARFVQHGSFDVLDGVGLEAARLYPLSSPLLHAMGMLAFDRDVLSPFINAGWLALCLLAAWCIGRRYGLAHVCVLGAAVTAGLPILAATQPGQASSDIGAMALFLTAIALLLERDLRPPPLAIAGLALGMAVSTKITVAVPAAVIAVGVLALLVRRHRWSAVSWIGGIVATGGFWFARNWWLVGSPLPWFDIRLGPLHLPVHEGAAAVASGEPALVHSITDGDAWRIIYIHGLWHSLSRGWPVVFVLLALTIAVIVVRAPTAMHRVVGTAIAIGFAGWFVTPYTGMLNFASGLRFLCPLVLVGFVVASTVLPATARWRWFQLAALSALALVSVTMPTFERVPTWPGRVAAITFVVVVVSSAIGAGIVIAGRHRPGVAWVGAGGAIALVAVGGWMVQDTYLRNRYVDVGLPNDTLNELFRDVQDARVGVFGTDDTYPMFGIDLSNDVRRGDDPPFDVGPDACRTWREHLAEYDYVAIAGSPDAFGFYPTPPPEVFDDPAAEVVLADESNTVYRIDGKLDAATCAPPP
jgi:hypothetical protein